MVKNKNLLIYIVLALVFSLLLTACGSSDDKDGKDAAKSGGELRELEEAFAEQPVMLTSIGQSADVEMIKALLDNAGIEYKMEKLLKANELGEEKTLILAVGGSSKGLGAAGIDAGEELSRTEDLIDGAKDKEMKIITMHIGGEARRGELSDRFIGPASSAADYIIIVDEGNKDDMFTNIAIEEDIPMEIVGSIA
ncbi:MAG TPA: DUF6305 family protein, partial [Clostridia bacterium]|nr:DUF6305 family protein [Clostridia bacterium]